MNRKVRVKLCLALVLLLTQTSCVLVAALNFSDPVAPELKRVVGDYLKQGITAYDAQNYPVAIKSFQKIIDLYPDDSNAHLWISKAYRKSGDHAKALQSLKSAQAIGPEQAITYHELGLLYTEMGNHTASLESAQKALQLEPTNQVLQINLGITYYNLKQYADAKEALVKLLAAGDVKDVNAYTIYGLTLLRLKDPELARKQFEKALQLNPVHAEAIFGLGEYFYSTDKLDEAEKQYKLAFEKDIKDKSLIDYSLGGVYQKRLEYEKALEYYAKLPSSYQNVSRRKELLKNKIEAENPNSPAWYLKNYTQFWKVASAIDSAQASLICLAKKKEDVSKLALQKVLKDYLREHAVVEDAQLEIEESFHEYPDKIYQPIHFILRAKFKHSGPMARIDNLLLDGFEKTVYTGILNGQYCEFSNGYAAARSSYGSRDDYQFTNIIPNSVVEKYGFVLD
ncbi:MAG: tetratricopeptide repeat protein [Candidatus Sericytochromatia bacterium]